MSQDKRFVSAVVAGAMIMTGIVITGCAIRIPSSEGPAAMNLSGAPATDNVARSQLAGPSQRKD